MIIDSLDNASQYTLIHPGIAKAFAWLQITDLNTIVAGKYFIEGENIFALVQEYETLDAANEQMEAHKKYIDVQYLIKGKELVGLALLGNQTISKSYENETDFMLVADAPSFFATLSAGNFMIFYPTDLHMPCIKIDEPAMVKKVVVKVSL
jgi:YhcH/YjgK/YiaL family protein